MKIERWGRCHGEHLSALQERLCELVCGLITDSFRHEDPAAFVSSGFVEPPFVEGTLYVYRSSMAPYNIMIIAALDDLSAGVQYTLIMPESFDTRVIVPRIREQLLNRW